MISNVSFGLVCLVACCVLTSSLAVEKKRTSRGLVTSRADTIFGGQRNSECTARSGETGSCYSRLQCRLGGGIASGPCGFTSGVCCVRMLGFNETSQLKRSVLKRAADDDQLNYSYVIRAANRRVCQLRIDFRELNIAQPVLADLSAGSNAECSGEFMTVNEVVLCGHSVDQHIYVPLSQSFAPTVNIEASLMPGSAGTWNIMTTQLECQAGRTAAPNALSRTNSWSFSRDEEHDTDVDLLESVGRLPYTRSTSATDASLVAPAGCLQYYPNTTGTIKSFNFDDADEKKHMYLPNMNYRICINQPENEQLRLNFASFQLSVRNPVVEGATDTPDSTDDQCVWSGVQPESNNQDYLHVLRMTYVETPTTVASFFCGNVLNQMNTTYDASPYVLQFVSDGFVDATLNQEKGFRINYSLV